MVDFYIGTMGFSYRDWAGPFYPPGLPVSEFLSYYNRIFNAVEIDSTFYGTPSLTSVIRWRESTANKFRICLKVPRVITHDSGLVGADEEMVRFKDVISNLQEKLGVVLLQFPPSFSNENTILLGDFLKTHCMDMRFAVEFRHPSWYIPQTADMLSELDICWVATEFTGVPRIVEITTDIIFVRLVGKHGRFRTHDKEQIDVTPKLEDWWEWIRSEIDRIREVYVFFNDDFSGHAPASANRLKEIVGLPVVKLVQPKQLRLI